ncbi:MAG: hypothetical protein H0Z29_03835 [Candidatus Marinimicrobia bacterium]|nr:hypothetical protein [Candidatus Neomarinimicrobiota bacterium]
MKRSIFHIRVKDFSIQVERMLDARLRKKPIAIISSNAQNGTVVSASPEAEEEGIRPGLKVLTAKKIARGVIFLPFNRSLYAQIHEYIYRMIKPFSPVIEPLSYGQFFVDMTGMDGIYKSSVDAGCLISKTLLEKVNLSSRIRISTNKLVSCISTAVVPENVYLVEEGKEPLFLSPLASSFLPTVSLPDVKKIVSFLLLKKVKNIQEITEDRQTSEAIFRNYSRKLYMESHGKDNSAVKPPTLKEHIVEQTVLTEDTNDEDSVMTAFIGIAEQVAYQLRIRKQIARSVKVEVHYSDGFKGMKKGRLLSNSDSYVISVCIDLFHRANYRRNRIRSILIDAWDFAPYVGQLNIFFPEKDRNLSIVVDRIRNKYGFSAIFRASELKVFQTKSSEMYG